MAYTLDGQNLETVYGITFRRIAGAHDFLKRQGETAHVWLDEDGEEEYVTATDIFFQSRDITLYGQMIASTRATLLSNLESFKAKLESPGLHALVLPYEPGKTRYVYSKDGGTFEMQTAWGTHNSKFMAEITVVLHEPNPARAA